jgi:hypothetical protein
LCPDKRQAKFAAAVPVAQKMPLTWSQKYRREGEESIA